MSLSSARDFLSKASSSPMLSDKILSASKGNLADIFAASVQVGREEGFDFTPEEIAALFESCRTPQPLSDDQLDQVAGAGDFSSLPPEINSINLFAGAGSNPMVQAGAAWDAISAELSSTAGQLQNTIAGLTNGTWTGTGSIGNADAFSSWLAGLASNLPGN